MQSSPCSLWIVPHARSSKSLDIIPLQHLEWHKVVSDLVSLDWVSKMEISSFAHQGVDREWEEINASCLNLVILTNLLASSLLQIRLNRYHEVYCQSHNFKAHWIDLERLSTQSHNLLLNSKLESQIKRTNHKMRWEEWYLEDQDLHLKNLDRSWLR